MDLRWNLMILKESLKRFLMCALLGGAALVAGGSAMGAVSGGQAAQTPIDNYHLAAPYGGITGGTITMEGVKSFAQDKLKK
jgi:hypothetical protein